MEVLRVLRGGTRNQSTADYSRQNLFPFGNRYYSVTAKNIESEDTTMENGVLLKRGTDLGTVEPIVDAANIGKCIGIARSNGEVVLTENETTPINMCIRGDIDGSLLVLPGVATLDSSTGSGTLRDLLTSLGFVIVNAVEGTKFDN